MEEEVVGVAAGVLAVGVAAQWLGWRLRVPAVVFLLGAGLVAGPLTGALEPDDTFGELLFPIVSIAVAVILFEGALGLGLRGMREAGRTVWLLLIVGAAITLIGTAFAARLVLDVDWWLSALIAAVLVVTGPTVIGPIVRSIRLEGRVAAILETEGTLIDPIGAILTVLTFEALFVGHRQSGGELAMQLTTTFLAGAVVGLVFALAIVVAFARYLVPDQLHNATTLAAVVTAFAVANALREESGLVAVTVMGIALASQHRVAVQHVLDFNETLRIIFISGLFLLLGARIEADTLRDVEWQNAAFLALLVVVVRPVSVLVSTVRSSLTWRERAFLACTAPRGIVAAAVASIFSLRLAELGRDGSQVLVSTVFTVITGTVLLSGLGSRRLATRLHLIERDVSSMIVLGANPVARTIATALEGHGAPVRLVDLDRGHLSTARMSGLAATRGSVITEDTWEAAGLANATCFLALTASDELNALATRHAAARLGRRSVFQLAASRPEHQSRWALPVGTFARTLFDPAANLGALAGLLEEGWEVRSTPLTDQFGPEEHGRVHPNAVPLFIVDARGSIELAATDVRPRPRAGVTYVALVPPGPADGRRRQDGPADDLADHAGKARRSAPGQDRGEHRTGEPAQQPADEHDRGGDPDARDRLENRLRERTCGFADLLGRLLRHLLRSKPAARVVECVAARGSTATCPANRNASGLGDDDTAGEGHREHKPLGGGEVEPQPLDGRAMAVLDDEQGHRDRDERTDDDPDLERAAPPHRAEIVGDGRVRWGQVFRLPVGHN